MDDEIDIYMLAVAISNLSDELKVPVDKLVDVLSEEFLKSDTEDVRFELETNGWL